jgi:RNA polymerase sigma factor (sigma-70 family)
MIPTRPPKPDGEGAISEAWAAALAYRPLLESRLIRPFLRRGLDADDLVQEGLIGMRRAAELYDPARGTLAGHLCRRAVTEMDEALWRQGQAIRYSRREYKRRRREGRLARRDHVPPERVPARAERIDPVLYREALGLLANLDGRERRVLEAYYLEGKSYARIGAEIGLTRQGTHVLARRALARLRASDARSGRTDTARDDPDPDPTPEP